MAKQHTFCILDCELLWDHTAKSIMGIWGVGGGSVPPEEFKIVNKGILLGGGYFFVVWVQIKNQSVERERKSGQKSSAFGSNSPRWSNLSVSWK